MNILQREQPDRHHHRQEHHPARDQHVGRGRGLVDAWHRELWRRAGVRSDRVRERPLHRVAVDRDRAPVDQVPPLGEVRPQRHDQRVGIRRVSADRRGRLLLAVRVGDGDDREPRLDRLVVGQLDRSRRSVEHAAGRGHGLDQVGVGRGGTRQRQPDRERDQAEHAPPRGSHTSSLSPARLPLMSSANRPAISPTHAEDQGDDRHDRDAAATERGLGLDRRGGVGIGLRARPVDDRTVGVGLLDLEGVGPRRGRLGEELEQRILPGGDVAPRPGHLRDHGAVARAGLLHDLVPARRRRHERVDRKPARHRHHDLGRPRAGLLGGHREAVQLELARQRHRRAHARVGRRGRGEERAPRAPRSAARAAGAPATVCSFEFDGPFSVGGSLVRRAAAASGASAESRAAAPSATGRATGT